MIISFKAIRQRLERHVVAHSLGGVPFVGEALLHLEQLDWLCRRLETVERETAGTDSLSASTTPGNLLPDPVIELKTLTEAFYYVAWRFVALLDGTAGPVPCLRGLKRRCSGIRMVRNQLLEHPEGKDSGIHIPSIMFGTSKGPTLKVCAAVKVETDGTVLFRTNEDHLLDAGLWQNARQLKEEVENCLSACDVVA